MRAKIGKGLLTFVALFTAIAPFLADWNETHIYNPDRPPHAKFHDGQTMAMGVLLGVATLYFLWRRRGAPSTNLLSAGILLAIYWVGQMAAFLFPGTPDPRRGAHNPRSMRLKPAAAAGFQARFGRWWTRPRTPSIPPGALRPYPGWLSRR